MRFRSTMLLTMLIAVFAFSGAWAADAARNWPGFRGDNSGVSPEKNLPVYWSATENIAWKTPMPCDGDYPCNSSPVIWGDRIFLTSSADAGKKRSVLCIDAKDGKIIWQKDIAVPAEKLPKTYAKNGYASASCATDGEKVFAFFDSPGLVALDMTGNVVWTRELGPFNTDWGMAGSPIVYKDLVIIPCDPDKDSFIIAVNKSNGEPRWRTPRPPCGRQYATPIVITVGGKDQIVVNGGTVVAYNPDDGKEIWSCRGMMSWLTPSAAFANGLVYTTSGRNGPSMAIDPTGRGDVTDTHVRMRLNTFGPYVPSPVVYPLLMLPSDNGVMRFIDDKGNVVIQETVQEKLKHFTSSPVAGDNKIYWASELGNVFVIDVSDCTGKKPRIKTLAINPMGERILAAPAIANGRIYIRSDKNLFCVTGGGKIKAVAAAKTAATFAELKKSYDDHPAAEGPNVAIRLEAIEALAPLKDPQAIPFLFDVAMKDNHWDVSEAAVKVLGQHDQPAIPTMIKLVEDKDWRPYLKIVSANHLGRLGAAEAVPALLAAAKQQNDPLVRAECVKAIAQIAAARDAEVAKVIPGLTAGLDDREGIVKEAAIRGLGGLAAKAGDQRDAIVQKLLDCAADRNVLVSAAAVDVLTKNFDARDEVMKDQVLYGEQRKPAVAENVVAGPIRAKFQDGELRYICVGDKEIVRRIYFAVRDERWDTVMPEFSQEKVEKTQDGFKVSLAGVCRNDLAELAWTGTITGTADGKITFKADGTANRDFTSPRIGFCVLFGTDSLAGQQYELVAADGKATPGEFPKNVSAKMLADVNTFQALRYTAADGMQVSVSVSDGLFGMEDQRNFGDSSYKAMAGFALKYPKVLKDEKGTQTVTIEVKNAKAQPTPQQPARVTVGAVAAGSQIPKLLPMAQSQKPANGFMTYNGDPKKHADAELVQFGYKPALHMPDDDMFMENATAILDQVRSIRAFAAKAKFRLDPVNFDTPYARPMPDPRDARNRGLFAAAWSTIVMKYLALGGVDTAVLGVGPGYADLALKMFEPYTGKPVLATTVTPACYAPVDAVAIDDGGELIVWIANKTDQPQKAVVAGLTAAKAQLQRINAATQVKSGPAKEKADVKNGELAIELGPFEVCRIAVPKK